MPQLVTGDQSCPCRRCLQDGQLGEEMLLVSYNPFLGASPYTGPGPVFVHRDTCEQYQCDGTVPEQQRRRLLAVRSYDKDHMMKDFAIVGGTDLEEKAEELLGRAGASYALVYYAGPGCFAARVDRR